MRTVRAARRGDARLVLGAAAFREHDPPPPRLSRVLYIGSARYRRDADLLSGLRRSKGSPSRACRPTKRGTAVSTLTQPAISHTLSPSETYATHVRSWSKDVLKSSHSPTSAEPEQPAAPGPTSLISAGQRPFIGSLAVSSVRGVRAWRTAQRAWNREAVTMVRLRVCLAARSTSRRGWILHSAPVASCVTLLLEGHLDATDRVASCEEV